MNFIDFINKFHKFEDLSRKYKILLIGFYLREYTGLVEFSSKNINECCKGIIKPPSNLKKKLNEISKGRNSSIIKGSKIGYYYLSAQTIDEVQRFLSNNVHSNDYIDKFANDAISYLKKTLAKLTAENQRKFIAEAISCLQVDARRATIIMIWAGVIDHLYDYIIRFKLNEFNTALKRRSDKYNRITIVKKDDFSDIRESIFIEVARSANIISNDVRKILDEKLGIRNSSAHPSGIEIHGTKVVNFIEDLIDNVIIKYEL